MLYNSTIFLHRFDYFLYFEILNLKLQALYKLLKRKKTNTKKNTALKFKNNKKNRTKN